MQAPIKAFIFDMDGTIVDSMPTHEHTWLAFARQHGLEASAQDIMQRTTGRNGAECVKELLGQHLSDAAAWQLVAEKEALYRQIFSPIFKKVTGFSKFYKNALDCGMKLGIGTAGDQANIAFVQQHLRLQPAPLAWVGGDEGLRGKPNPDIFLEVARRLQVKPEHCLVFEDAVFGIEAARRAGMRAIAICTGASAAQLAGPHVLASAPHFDALLSSRFLESLHVA